MGNLLDYENPVLSFLSKLADLIILNLLTILGCIPLVTIGASLTAAHYAALKLYRKEDYVARNFWKSFKENWKQSTVIWLVFITYVIAAYLAFITLSTGNGGTAFVMQGCLLAAFVMSLWIMLWALPLQSKFINPVRKTIKTAFLMAFKHIFRTLIMFAVCLLPAMLSIQWYTLLLLFGFSFPIYLCAVIYNKVFEKMEKRVLEEMEGISNDCIS